MAQRRQLSLWASSLLVLMAPCVLSKPALPKDDHDSLNMALQAVARQKRALMLEYGQPEDIGYGYQKAARSLQAALMHQQQQQQQQQHQKHPREVAFLLDDLVPQRRSAPTMFRERLRGVDKRMSNAAEQRELAEYVAAMERAQNIVEPMGMKKVWEHRHHRPEEWTSNAVAEADRERFLRLLNELHRRAEELEEEKEEANGIPDTNGEGGMWPMVARRKKETPWFLPEEDDAVAMAAAASTAEEEDGEDDEVDDAAGRPAPVEWSDEPDQFNLPKRITKRGDNNVGATRRLIFKTKNHQPLEVRRKHKNKGDVDPTDSTIRRELDSIFEGDAEKKDKNDKKDKKEKKGTEKKDKSPDKRKAKSNATDKSAAVPPSTSVVKTTSTPLEAVKAVKMTKKSVDWSEYFGIDKRSVVPADWLRDEYFKMMAMATNVRKRSAGPVLGPMMSIPNGHGHGNSLPPPPALQRMASQLDSMADNAIGDALKYTGAHQGVTNHEQMADVKAEVTARLLAAYRLEALRHSLETLRKTLENGGHYIQNEDPIDLQEGPEVVFSSNQIPSDTRSGLLMDTQEDNRVHETGSCLALRQMASDCEAASHLAGEHAPHLMEACTRRQVCSVCGVSLGAVSPSTCEASYFQSAQMICGDDPECRDRARRLAKGLSGLQVHSFRREMVTECADDPCVLQIFRQ